MQCRKIQARDDNRRIKYSYPTAWQTSWQKYHRLLPPLAKAASVTKTGGVAVLATHSVWRSTSLLKYVRDSGVEKNGVKVSRIDCSEMVNLVESGEFVTDSEKCVNMIRKILRRKFEKNNIDSATLSSTHLPFLLPILQKEFPNVKFFDPAKDIARIIKKRLAPSTRNKLSVYTSSDVKTMQKKLKLLQIKQSRFLILAT